MIGSALLPFLLVLGAVALAGVVYLRREPAVRGRGSLLVVRVAALLLLGLLLVNPSLPDPDGERPRETAWWVLVEAGPALDVPSPEHGTLHDEVADRAAAEGRAGARLALAGPEPEGVDTATLRATTGRRVVEDLRPSLVRLAEAGADSILLLSPFRTTRAALDRALADLPVPVRLERVGEPVRNAGILELDLPLRVPTGETVEGIVTLFGEGAAEGDSVTIEIEADGVVVESRAVLVPRPGERMRLALELPPVADTGTVRYVARAILEDDRFPADDARARRVRVGPPEGGIVLVSLRPDWEPRVLLPVLEAGTGLEGEGFLRLGAGDRWMPLGRGDDPARTVAAAQFRDRIARSGLLVVHGVDGEVPAWLREAAGSHPRVIHLPAGPEGFRLAGVPAGGARGGEWTVDPELPASPVAPFLSGIPLAELPALADARPPSGGSGTAVLRLRSVVGGESAPALVLTEQAGGRRAVAHASGFWRWGNRSGTPRETYRGLWSGVAGWLLASDPVAGAGQIRPLRSVVVQGEGVEWIAPDGADGTLTLTFSPAETGGEGGSRVEGDPVAEAGLPEPIERSVVLDAAGRGVSAPLPAGRWRWEGTIEHGIDPGPDGRDGTEPLEGAGEVEVERWTGALALPPLEDLPDLVEADPDALAAPEPAGPAGRPFRTLPLPYLLLLGLLCAEWIGRRRVGLR